MRMQEQQGQQRPLPAQATALWKHPIPGCCWFSLCELFPKMSGWPLPSMHVSAMGTFDVARLATLSITTTRMATRDNKLQDSEQQRTMHFRL